jgi:hypothetical protein
MVNHRIVSFRTGDFAAISLLIARSTVHQRPNSHDCESKDDSDDNSGNITYGRKVGWIRITKTSEVTRQHKCTENH